MSAVIVEHGQEAHAGGLGRPIVIVGTGPVGIHLAERLIGLNPRQPLVLYGDEPWEPYDRVRLSLLLNGEVGFSAIQNTLKVPAGSPVLQHHNCAVASIDPRRRTLTDSLGRTQAYASLVLAVGSRPHIPTIEGIGKGNVFAFRNMTDVLRLQARQARSRHTVVLGGGLLGLEAARALSRHGTRVTVVEHAQRVMPAQLDAHGSVRLLGRIRELGIEVLLGNGVESVGGAANVEWLQLRDGRLLPCDTLVVATGIRPNIELARGCGLRVGRGIVVDDCLQTSIPGIHAIGECAEHRGRVHGLVGPGLDQAEVLSHHLCGERVCYQGSTSSVSLKVVGMPVMSLELTEDEAGAVGIRTHVHETEAGYRKLYLSNCRITGAVGVGEWPDLARVREALEQGRRVWPWQTRRFRRSGSLWPLADSGSLMRWPADAVVCNCRGIRQHQIVSAWREGQVTVEALTACTGAGTVCGSCRPLLAGLVGSSLDTVMETGGRSLLLTGMVSALLLVLVMLFAPALPSDVSIASWQYRLSELWRDSLWKQVSGFSLLGLALLSLLVSARKRMRRFGLGSFGQWRGFHALLGGLALLVLLVHTGGALGERINQWLVADFLLLALVGAVLGAAVRYEQTRAGYTGKRLRTWFGWAHLLAAWPLPLLLVFHVLSVYYF